MTDALPIYELYAIRYASREGRRSENFIGGDPNDAPMPMDYFVWVAVSPTFTLVIDTGLSRETAAKRKRAFLHSPIDILRQLGVEPNEVKDVVLTHLHNDHTGFIPSFPAARFHLQESEMHFATGHYMQYPRLARAFEVEDVINVVRLCYAGRVKFHFGAGEIAPGITLHLVGGHSGGQQFVRVHTARGWVVVAADVTHYYENMESGRPFAQAFNVGEMLDGFGMLMDMAPTAQHIVPGHDPLVMQRYPAPRKDLEGIVVRLDVAPSA
jgi:glyoxylase-like metal-dependent hydrolase (beta-lactamase superfamily II)